MKLKKKQKAQEQKNKIVPVERFGYYTNSDMYLNAHIKGVEPMTAKELTEEQQEEALNDPNNYVEEKFDGTRATLHFYKVDPFTNMLFGKKSIEDRALTYELLRGTGFTKGSERVYNFFTSNPYDRKKMAAFLKKEFGVGGHSGLPCIEGFEVANNHSPKGLEIIIGDYADPLYNKTFKWEYVADRVEDLIEEGVYYPEKAYTRCFSRRVSKKTDWYCENTDSLPHLRDLCIPELAGTIIDGEMFIPDRPFKDVSSTLNCTWDKAVERQEQLGKIVFHAFDILYYKGTPVEKLPLYRRKQYLKKVIEEINSPYVVMVDYYSCDKVIRKPLFDNSAEVSRLIDSQSSFPELFRCYDVSSSSGELLLSPKAYYEYIVFKGGEGVIIKPKDGKYLHKRGWEYSKIKKYLTRELIVTGFSEPTKEYTGKFPNNHWDYWVDEKDQRKPLSSVQGMKADKLIDLGYTPVTRHWYENQVGQLKLGVLISNEDYHKIPIAKRGDAYTPECLGMKCKDSLIMQVCECSGFDDEQRDTFTQFKEDFVGSVVEVKANELFKDTGKMRHPRFLRVREDKNPESCTWEDHII